MMKTVSTTVLSIFGVITQGMFYVARDQGMLYVALDQCSIQKHVHMSSTLPMFANSVIILFYFKSSKHESKVRRSHNQW